MKEYQVNEDQSTMARPGLQNGERQASAAEKANPGPAALSRPLSMRAPGSILALQRRFGNRHVRSMIALQRKSEGEPEVTAELESSIERARGGGQGMDSSTRSQMESAFAADFSGVRIHTGAESHVLNRAVNAVAFTTGQDIFFREGAYDPGSTSGKELLAHELTHVVQQGAAVQRRTTSQAVTVQRMCPACEEEKKDNPFQAKLVVGAPDDQYEQEAQQVARAVAGSLDLRRGSDAPRLRQERTAAPERQAASAIQQSLQRQDDSESNGTSMEEEDDEDIIVTASSSGASLQREDDGSDGGQQDDGGGAVLQTISTCTPTARFTDIPSGTVPATFGSGMFGAPFKMVAEFTNPPVPCNNCIQGEYRQSVRGWAKRNGRSVTHALCSNTMSPTAWYEDCITLGGTNYKYGYHSIPFGNSVFSNPNQATGCTFTGTDSPGFLLSSVRSGDKLEMHFEFQAKLVDAFNGDAILSPPAGSGGATSAAWTVEGTGTVP